MTLSRQHANTDIAELVGLVCERLIAIPGSSPDVVLAVYLRADGKWYRFFLDVGVLFFDESSGPDAEDDLEAGAEYVDLGHRMQCEGQAISEMRMDAGTLALRFRSGVSLLFTEFQEGARVAFGSGA